MLSRRLLRDNEPALGQQLKNEAHMLAAPRAYNSCDESMLYLRLRENNEASEMLIENEMMATMKASLSKYGKRLMSGMPGCGIL